jgi:segregation and condensation protein A
MYELKIEKFNGPLEKLLELIEERKLKITEISLAEITGDFLNYLKSLEKVEMPDLADFIAVAGRLLLIKSKSLLPDLALTPEEEGEIKDLEKRLLFYAEFRKAKRTINRLWQSGEKLHTRPYFLNHLSDLKVFYPAKNASLESLNEAINKIFKEFEGIINEKVVVKEKIISLEEKIKEILKRFESIKEDNFENLAKSKSRLEIVVIFLAILHLAREQLVSLEQSNSFSNIIIKSAGNISNG